MTSFRTVLHRFRMETTEDGACSPISRPRVGAGAVRLDGPTGRVDRLGEPAWQRIYPLPVLGMAPVRPLGAPPHSAGSRSKGRFADKPAGGRCAAAGHGRTRGPRWSAGHVSKLTRPMPRVEPERPCPLRTGVSITAKGWEPAHAMLNIRGLARGAKPPLDPQFLTPPPQRALRRPSTSVVGALTT